jgi:hypothetical protein
LIPLFQAKNYVQMKEDWIIIVSSPEKSKVDFFRNVLKTNGIESFLLRGRQPFILTRLYIPKHKKQTALQLIAA